MGRTSGRCDHRRGGRHSRVALPLLRLRLRLLRVARGRVRPVEGAVGRALEEGLRVRAQEVGHAAPVARPVQLRPRALADHALCMRALKHSEPGI